VARLRAEARECFERHDAAHAQAGRFYRHAERLDAGSAALLARLRDALDPDRRMNPGVLGLG
jgi:FAD/FMN-containing dehydrogenase